MSEQMTAKRLSDLIIEHGRVDESFRLKLTGAEVNELRDELIELRRLCEVGGVTRDRINAARGIVPMTLEQARQVVRAVLDLRYEPEERA